MTLQAIFNYLQEHKTCTVKLADATTAESVRQMLVKKWNKEKVSRADLGFLDEVTAELVVSLEAGKIAEDFSYQEFTFYLRPKKRRGISYEIVVPNSKLEE